MSTNSPESTEPAAPEAPRDAHNGRLVERLFELRMIIAILFAIYGVVCVIWGAAFTSSRDLTRAAGINVNLYAGIGMLVVAVLFGAWALLNPIEEAKSTDEQQEGQSGDATQP